eukprot:4330383-Ditylum_brightwellii.AAC.1
MGATCKSWAVFVATWEAWIMGHELSAASFLKKIVAVGQRMSFATAIAAFSTKCCGQPKSSPPSLVNTNTFAFPTASISNAVDDFDQARIGKANER